MDQIFDFGFTAVDEDELDAVKTAEQNLAGTDEQLENVQDKLDSLMNAILPLLNNLKSNPEKEYILWPNRLTKVEEFESQLLRIYKGE
jgi:outer membrane protein TolC